MQFWGCDNTMSYYVMLVSLSFSKVISSFRQFGVEKIQENQVFEDKGPCHDIIISRLRFQLLFKHFNSGKIVAQSKEFTPQSDEP